MTEQDIVKFADDLRQFARLEVTVKLAKPPCTMHILSFNGVDFFFYATAEKQYDGWGSGNPDLPKRLHDGDLTIRI